MNYKHEMGDRALGTCIEFVSGPCLNSDIHPPPHGRFRSMFTASLYQNRCVRVPLSIVCNVSCNT